MLQFEGLLLLELQSVVFGLWSVRLVDEVVGWARCFFNFLVCKFAAETHAAILITIKFYDFVFWGVQLRVRRF